MTIPSMSRRKWLKASVALSGAFTIAPSLLDPISASPIRAIRTTSLNKFTEEAIAREFPKLKARLFANENPFGPSEKVKQAIVEALDGSYKYPIIEGQQLAEQIAAFEGLKKEQIVIAPGSTTLLRAAAVHFSKSGAILSGDPTYEDLPASAEKLKAGWTKIPLTKDHILDLDAMEESVNKKTSLVYICNPNNPTGTVLDKGKLKSFCERVSKKVPVFVDEAYIDYLGDPKDHSMMGLIKEGYNVIVARTFSKLYGFAGLRVGYVGAQEKMIEQLGLYTWPESGLAMASIAGAIAGFRDTEFLSEAYKKTIESKEFLYEVLTKEGYTYIPSSTNFVMFPVPINAERFVEEMMKRGVGVRPWRFNKKEWCRVSIGTMKEMEAFAEAFREIS